MKSPKTLQEAIQFFADYDNCRQFMISVRWLDGKVRCPYCGSEKLTYLEKARLYRCYGDHPKQKFSLRVGTVFEDSHIPLEKWLPAVWLLVNSKNGISSYELHRALGVTQKTAWFMLHRIRLAMQTGSFVKMGGGGSEVEVDETYIGANARWMHKDKKLKIRQAQSMVPTSQFNYMAKGNLPNKIPVMGMLDREARQIRVKVLPNAKRETIQNQILNQVEHGSKLYTDQAVAYDKLVPKYAHEVVNHLEGYVNGRVHTNGLENFWSLLKRSLRGTYVAVEPFHLFRYVDEQAWRYNHRATKDNKITDADRFALALSQIAGKRLTYQEVTGKVGEASA